MRQLTQVVRVSSPNGVPFLRLDGLDQVHELPEAVAFG